MLVVVSATAQNLTVLWPTTFFLGRDGRVHGVHADFPGRASGEFHSRTTEEVVALVERLLAGS